MKVDIGEFLERFSADELAEKGILRGETRLLNNRSVSPLLKLMSDHGITRVEAADRSWFLSSDGEFQNPLSEEAKSGLISDFANPGSVFNLQNVSINSHYGGGAGAATEQDGDAATGDDDAAADLKFGLERDLQEALRSNIEQLEPGLKIIDDGKERIVEAGRIDIIAQDSDGNLVIIELKAGIAPLPAIAQLLSYMGSDEVAPDRPVRGILIANAFHPRLVIAARAVPNVTLVSYSFQFSFQEQ